MSAIDAPSTGGVRPTAEQELLLDAILRDGAEATAAWRRWAGSVDFSQLDAGSARLLPLLYRQLAVRGTPAADIEGLRAEYVRTWQTNQFRLRDLRDVVGLLQDAGVPVLLLKGAALLVAYCPDPGLRPMGDCDLLVPYALAPRALSILARAGWKPNGASPHAQPLTHEKGFDLDLHWNLFVEESGPTVDEPFWHAALPAPLGERTVRVLAPADQLLHVCVHGAQWSPTPGVRWVADAAMLLAARPDLDWDRLIAQAERCRLTLAAGLTLGYLRDRFSVGIPDDVLRRLRTDRISRAERRQFARLSTATDARPLLFEAWMLAGYYARSARARRAGLSPAGFLRYLADLFELERVRDLPRYTLTRLKRHEWRRPAERRPSARHAEPS